MIWRAFVLSCVLTGLALLTGCGLSQTELRDQVVQHLRNDASIIRMFGSSDPRSREYSQAVLILSEAVAADFKVDKQILCGATGVISRRMLPDLRALGHQVDPGLQWALDAANMVCQVGTGAKPAK